MRPSKIDGCAGTEEILKGLVKKIRTRFPKVRIIFRGDSGFCRESILKCCEDLHIHYVVGLAKNPRLLEVIEPQKQAAEELHRETDKASRVFTRFSYRTKKSWSRKRDVVAKAEHLQKGSNPRFVVTNVNTLGDKGLYEKLYCGRGNMENRIKDQQLDLFATRTSTAWMSSNQLRLWFSAFAYVFFLLLKRFIPANSPFRKHLPSTLRLKLFKVAAAVRVSVRRISISLPKSFPYWDIWCRIATTV